jgi:hypothetical protein
LGTEVDNADAVRTIEPMGDTVRDWVGILIAFQTGSAGCSVGIYGMEIGKLEVFI